MAALRIAAGRPHLAGRRFADYVVVARAA